MPFLAAAGDLEGALPSSLVSAPVLEARIAEAQDAVDMTDEARDRLVAQYRKSLSNLETAQANEAAAAAYRGTAEDAPAQIEALRDARAEALADDPLAQLDLDRDTPLSELQRRLQEERADLAAVQARHDDLDARLALLQARPRAVRQQLSQADEARETAYASLQAEIAKGADEERATALAEARRWELETRYHALSSEIQMLDQELLSRPVRLELLQAQLDKEAASIQWIGARVAALEGRILTARQQAAEKARADAEQVRRNTAGMDPVLVQLSEANAALSREIEALTAATRGLDRAQARAERLTERINADYRDARETLDAGEVTGGLGAVLLEQLDALPDLSDVRQQRAGRRARIAESKARRLRHRAEARRLSDIEASVKAFEAELKTAPTAAQNERLNELVAHRVELLERMLATEELYLAKTQAVDAAEAALLAGSADYKALLVEQLLWLRTEPPTNPSELLVLPDQIGAMLETARDAKLAGRLTRQLAESPVFWAALALAAGLLWRRRWIVAAITDISKHVGKPTTDRFGHTLRVLGLTVLLALPLPLLVGAAGWALRIDPAGTELTQTLGHSLLRIALLLFTLKLLTALCRPRGLAAAHFRWSEHNLRLLRTESRRLAWILIPAAVLLKLAVALDPVESGGTMFRLAGTVAFTALAWFLYRVFHPRRGVFAQLRRTEDFPLLKRTYWLWYLLLVLCPLALVGLGLSGYLYTVTVESENYTDSLLLLLAVVLLYSLSLRWLLVVRRRLAYEAALERRRAALEAATEARDGGEAAELQIEEPEVDLSALSADARALIRIGSGVVAAVGLVLIWSNAGAALRPLEDIILWHTTVLVDGAQEERPVTLLDLARALLFAAGTLVLLKRLPALLEILLLRREAMSAADRYAVTTLISYVVGAIGILLVFGTLGASWTQLQWMAAALSVGIGFGLQEIVANFISGLIILFERPIRVGDTITVGDTDGVVTRIRIRATTIRNWDRKELLVPNKEFITGRLLNWTLTDQLNRVTIPVGVAYGTDTRKALAILAEVADQHERLLKDPAPLITFESFGDNALTLVLRCYLDSLEFRLATITELHQTISDRFAAAGINIAFPQRDVHLHAAKPLDIRLHRDHGTPLAAEG